MHLLAPRACTLADFLASQRLPLGDKIDAASKQDRKAWQMARDDSRFNRLSLRYRWQLKMARYSAILLFQAALTANNAITSDIKITILERLQIGR